MLARGFQRLRSTSVMQRSFSRSIATGTIKYTKDHEYIRVDGPGKATVGISEHAQKALGDVVYVELPEKGTKYKKGDTFGSVESVKAASSIYAPVDLEVTEVNSKLSSECSLVNQSAEGTGWMLKVKFDKENQFNDLMDAKAYAAHCDIYPTRRKQKAILCQLVLLGHELN